MPPRKGLLAPQNTFLDTIATRFDGTHSNFVLGNAQVGPMYPIVYCSDGFCDLTGYPRAHIMQKGCACRFLYGEETDDDSVRQIEEALQEKAELKVEVQFYRRNGASFWCLLDVVPIKNEKREVVLFLASHKDITSTKLAELREGDGSDSDGDSNDQHHHGPNSPVLLSAASSAVNYGRRRSRAVLYQLSGHYSNKQDKMKAGRKLRKINSNLLHSPTPLPEYKTSAVKKSKLILLHYGAFKTCWDWIVLLATVYVAIVVPYNASFTLDEYTQRPSVPADVVVEAVFIFDIVVNFRTTFVNKKGEVVSNPSKIALNYASSWFAVDLLAALPFDSLYAANVYSKDTMVHLLKLTRLLRLLRLLQKMERYSEYSAMILTLMMLCFTLVAHWLACIWYVIAQEEKLASGDDWDIGWINNLANRIQVPVTNLTISNYYTTSLYFTCSSLTSVGFGNVAADTDAEKIFSICTMLIGALMHAVVFGNVTAIIQRMYSRRNIHQSKLRDLKEFLKIYRIPKELKQRMQDYYQTMWSLNHGIDIHETLREFPEELRGDVSMHIHREVLSLPIFETASQGCLKVLSLHIRANFCAPGEFLVHKGDALQYIYYLCNGSMEVVQNDMVVAILGKGDMVGCDVQMKDCLVVAHDLVIKSSCDVKALTYCDLKCIHLVGLFDVLKMYPEFAEEFAKDIVHDLTHNLREGYDSEQFNNQAEMHGRASSNLTLPSISENEEEAESRGSGSPSTPSRDPSSSAGMNNNKSSTATMASGNSLMASSAYRFPRKLQSPPPPIREEEEEETETNSSSHDDGESAKSGSSTRISNKHCLDAGGLRHCSTCPEFGKANYQEEVQQHRNKEGLWMGPDDASGDQIVATCSGSVAVHDKEETIKLLYNRILNFNKEIHDLMVACIGVPGHPVTTTADGPSSSPPPSRKPSKREKTPSKYNSCCDCGCHHSSSITPAPAVVPDEPPSVYNNDGEQRPSPTSNTRPMRPNSLRRKVSNSMQTDEEPAFSNIRKGSSRRRRKSSGSKRKHSKEEKVRSPTTATQFQRCEAPLAHQEETDEYCFRMIDDDNDSLASSGANSGILANNETLLGASASSFDLPAPLVGNDELYSPVASDASEASMLNSYSKTTSKSRMMKGTLLPSSRSRRSSESSLKKVRSSPLSNSNLAITNNQGAASIISMGDTGGSIGSCDLASTTATSPMSYNGGTFINSPASTSDHHHQQHVQHQGRRPMMVASSPGFVTPTSSSSEFPSATLIDIGFPDNNVADFQLSNFATASVKSAQNRQT